MKVFVPVAAVACGISGALAFQSSSTFRGARELSGTESFKFSPVRTIQARVVSSPPSWNAEAKAFLFPWGDTVELKYRSGMDSVNTASIEGALKFVQSEGIDYTSRGNNKTAWCKERKNNMQHVMFLDITFAQPEAAVAKWQGEYGSYAAMDNSQCTPNGTVGTSSTFPEECHLIGGTNGFPKIGAYIGGADKSTDPRAPYAGTWWFSYPNTCALESRTGNKTDACRASSPAGLCPRGTGPDGVACTFNYTVLGWVPIDDLVGITQMPTKASDAKTYNNFAEFCNDDNIEFQTDATGALTTSITFWKNPTDQAANAARAQALVDLYVAALAKTKTLTQVSSTDLEKFSPLPTVAELTAANPKCYVNDPKCAATGTYCKRDKRSQLCTVCTGTTTDCTKAPDGYTFPTLVQATPAPTTQAPSVTPAPSSSGTTPSPSSTKSAASSLSLSVVSAASVAVSLALSFVLA